MANIENVKRAIAVMAQVQINQFDITNWVREDGCGTVACFGGWLAISEDIPEMYMAGGMPAIWQGNYKVGISAIAEFLDIPFEIAYQIAGINTNADEVAITDRNFDYFYNKLSIDVTPADVIEKLKTLL